MDQHSFKNVKNPIDRLDAVDKAYADRIKYKTAFAVLYLISNTAFASGKIKICELWVERLADEWAATSSPMFATEWPDFHKFSRGPSLMTFFSDSLLVV